MKRINWSLMALTFAIAMGTAGAAPAADIAVPYYPPPAAFPPPALYNWTGIYVGGHVGGGWLNDTITQTTNTALFNAGTETDVDPAGFLGGAQFGANYEFAPWVIGVEGSFTWSSITGGTTALTIATATEGGITIPIRDRATASPQWLTTAAARFGYAANTYFFYLKGGAAWMQVEYTQETRGTPGSLLATFSLRDTRPGFVAGGGLEYGMTENWSAKFEYDFFDFGIANYAFNLGGVVVPVSIKSDIHIFTVGLNYRWN